VIVKHKQLDNVEMDQQVEQLLVEIIVLQDVKDNAHHLNHQELFLVNVIVMDKQYLNVEMDLLAEQLLVEIMKLQHVI
jgi:hypothetical protein